MQLFSRDASFISGCTKPKYAYHSAIIDYKKPVGKLAFRLADAKISPLRTQRREVRFGKIFLNNHS